MFLAPYFVVFVVKNNAHVNVNLPFLTTFFNIPLFLVIITSVIFGVTIQFFTARTGKKNKDGKKKHK